PGVSIGRDLNLLNVGGDLTLSNGANFVVGRFLGLTPQPPKGTATGSNVLALNQSLIGTGTSTLASTISGYIQGDLIIGPGSVFKVTSGIANSSSNGGSTPAPSPLLINGSLQVVSSSQVVVPNLLAGSTFSRPDPNNPGLFVVNNLVARNGIVVNGVVVVTHG
ncbi:MAG: hypothetical protein LC745_02100, partial [Planctomycetia bacterium]|nr:hypothetical protein [Planctomycetia bacterium]